MTLPPVYPRAPPAVRQAVKGEAHVPGGEATLSPDEFAARRAKMVRSAAMWVSPHSLGNALRGVVEESTETGAKVWRDATLAEIALCLVKDMTSPNNTRMALKHNLINHTIPAAIATAKAESAGCVLEAKHGAHQPPTPSLSPRRR